MNIDLNDDLKGIDRKKAELENQMANPDVYSNGEKAKAVQKQIDDITAQLEHLNEDWESAAERLDAAQ